MTDHLRTVASIQANVNRAMESVYSITGRTDQSVQDIIKLFPDHPEVKRYQDAVKAYDDARNERKE